MSLSRFQFASAVRRLLSAALVAVAFGVASGAAVAEPLDAVELLNFTCPHCRHLDRYDAQLSAEYAKQGGVWRMAPIEPSTDNLPDVSVRVWYAIDDLAGDAVADTAAKYLYLGYQKGATLDSVGGVYAWLSDYMTGLPTLKALRAITYSKRITGQWQQALGYFRDLSSRRVPAVILLDANAFAVYGVIQRGPEYPNAPAMYRALMAAARKAHAIHSAPIRLPWDSSGAPTTTAGAGS
jgi:hypothetical protein